MLLHVSVCPNISKLVIWLFLFQFNSKEIFIEHLLGEQVHPKKDVE